MNKMNNKQAAPLILYRIKRNFSLRYLFDIFAPNTAKPSIKAARVRVRAFNGTTLNRINNRQRTFGNSDYLVTRYMHLSRTVGFQSIRRKVK